MDIPDEHLQEQDCIRGKISHQVAFAMMAFLNINLTFWGNISKRENICPKIKKIYIVLSLKKLSFCILPFSYLFKINAAGFDIL